MLLSIVIPSLGAVAALGVCGLYNYALLRPPAVVSGRALPLAVRVPALALVLGVILWLPALAPPSYSALRFVLAILSALGVVRTWETFAGRPADARALLSLGRYLQFFLCVAEISFRKSDSPRDMRLAGARRISRGVAKAVLLAALYWLDLHWQERLTGSPVDTMWWLLVAYFSASGGSDFLSGAAMLVLGKRNTEVFRWPLVASSVSEFWGQRWNMTFRNSAYRLIFTPLHRRFGIVGATFCVFVWSAVLHEYTVLAALGRSEGAMTAFFMLQGLAVLLHHKVGRRLPFRVPRGLSIPLTWGWMLATAPLFFYPVRQMLVLW